MTGATNSPTLDDIGNNNTFDKGSYISNTTTEFYVDLHPEVSLSRVHPGGEEVKIFPNTYTTSAQVHVSGGIDVTFTGLGANKSMTVLKPSGNTGSSGDSRGWFLVDPGNALSMNNLTLDGTGFLVYQAIRHHGSGTIDNVHFTQIKYNESGPTYSGVAIAAFGNGNVDVTNCMFDNIGRVGVLYFGAGITNSLFDNNMYTGKGDGDFLDYALDIDAGAHVTVTNNSVSGNRGVASSDGSTSAGFLVTTYYGAGTTTDFSNNTITANTSGIVVGYDGSDVSTATANNNDIYGNTSFGVTSSAQIVDASNNWWGNASGPSGQGPGTGDAVSTNVDFCPWLDNVVGVGAPVGTAPVAKTKNITVQMPISGTVTITPEMVDDGSTGDCGGIQSLSLDITTFTCSDLGPNTVMLTVLDNANQTDTEPAIVTIVDPLPTISGCPGNIAVNNDPGLCSAVVNWTPPTASGAPVYCQSFEDPAFQSDPTGASQDWNDSGGGTVTRVLSGNNGITSKDGAAHAIVDETGGPGDGPYTRLGGYSSLFGNGFTVSLAVHLNMADSKVVGGTYGWDLSAAASRQSGSHLRDFIFHVSSVGEPNKIVIAGDNNTNFVPINATYMINNWNHIVITTTNWYYFQWVFRDNGGVLAVDMNLLDCNGNILFTETRSNAGDLIASVVGGNRYMWFTVRSFDELAIDKVKLEYNAAPLSSTHNPGDVFSVGTTTVTYTATSPSCGTPVTCSFDVTVTDNEPPVAKCKNITVQLDNTGNVNIAEDAVNDGSTDNCGISSYDTDGTHFDCDDVGANSVVLTVTDVNGNPSTCAATVTVEDNTPPEAKCKNFTTALNPDGYYTLAPSSVDDGSNDACGIAGLTVSPNQFDCGNQGANTVTLSVTDDNGNTANCNATVTITPFVTVTSIVVTDETCAGAADGTITINATSVGGNLIYSITGGSSFQTANTFLNLSPGVYNIVVLAQSTSGCTATDVAVVYAGGTALKWYKDLDNDGYSDGIFTMACSRPMGYKLGVELAAYPPTGGNVDCNDNNATIHPGAPELCDGLDNNCDGIIPANEADADGDGYRICDGDCNDANAAVHPGATEVCNGIDDDCDGQIDEGASGGLTYVGNVTFVTQAQVNAFSPCYSKIQGHLTIQGTGINNLSNLINLTEVTGNVSIKFTSLPNMGGLDNLTTIGGLLKIQLNNFGAHLTSLDGLDNLATIGSNLIITSNVYLSDCCSLEDLLSGVGVGGNIIIVGNAFGCQSVSQIITTCGGGGSIIIPPSTGVSLFEEVEVPGMKLFPNPATSTVTVRLDGLDKTATTLTIYDQLGRVAYVQELAEGQTNLTLNLDNGRFQNGIYMVSATTDSLQLTQRLVVAK